MKTLYMRIDATKPVDSPNWDKARGKLDPSMGYLIADRKTGALLERTLYLTIEQARTRPGMVISRRWWERRNKTKIKVNRKNTNR